MAFEVWRPVAVDREKGQLGLEDRQERQELRELVGVAGASGLAQPLGVSTGQRARQCGVATNRRPRTQLLPAADAPPQHRGRQRVEHVVGEHRAQRSGGGSVWRLRVADSRGDVRRVVGEHPGFRPPRDAARGAVGDVHREPVVEVAPVALTECLELVEKVAGEQCAAGADLQHANWLVRRYVEAIREEHGGGVARRTAVVVREIRDIVRDERCDPGADPMERRQAPFEIVRQRPVVFELAITGDDAPDHRSGGGRLSTTRLPIEQCARQPRRPEPLRHGVRLSIERIHWPRRRGSGACSRLNMTGPRPASRQSRNSVES